MTASSVTIPRFVGELLRPGDPAYDAHREVWNAAVDRRPALIARCTTAADVIAALRFGRESELEIAVKCGGHSIVGLSVPDGGLMLDLTPMRAVTVDPERRRATVQGGSLLRNLDRAAEPHGLATTAGNISHTGVGGLTLGGGMGWLARRFGLSCDNVERYTVVTADGELVTASGSENADLFWGLRGGGGNFGIVTEFEFRLHPITHDVLLVDLVFDAADGASVLRGWRELLPDAPREATLTADVFTDDDGRPAVSAGFVWVGDPEAGQAFLRRFRTIGTPTSEDIEPTLYVALQSRYDDNHDHGKRRYVKGHYFTEFSDAAIDAFLTRGVGAGESPDWTRIPGGGFQAYGGAIAEVADEDSAFDNRGTLIEFTGGLSWFDAAEDDERIARSRAFGEAIEPFASGIYVNTIMDEGEAGVRRAYHERKLARLAELKRRYDPDNVFHLNHNIRPASPSA